MSTNQTGSTAGTDGGRGTPRGGAHPSQSAARDLTHAALLFAGAGAVPLAIVYRRGQ